MSMIVGNNIGINNSFNTTSKSSGYNNIKEYSNYLKGKYNCLSPSKNVTVSVTSGLLRKAMSDEKTGEWLERELSKAPDYIKAARQSAMANGSKLTSVSIEFGEEYSTMTTIGVFGETGKDNDIDEWIERIKENKAEKKVNEENLLEQRSEEQSYTFKGKDMGSIIEQFSQKMATLNSAINSLGRFDMKV